VTTKIEGTLANSDPATVAGFGDEWARFDQAALGTAERQALFDQYFAVFPWESLPPRPVGFDLGCGSGRWAQLVAPRVAHLHCIDPSSALEVAKRNLRGLGNVSFHDAAADTIPLEEGSADFGYSLGVLHHIPDTQAGLAAAVRVLKPGAPFLLYLYYAFDNRPAWFRATWRASDLVRRGISRTPHPLRYALSQMIAATVYLPAARAAAALERGGMNVEGLPLSAYRRRSFYVMRTDALDRFGTRLEQRFTKPQIADMMRRSGLERIRFHDGVPYWVAVGYRRAN